MAPVVEMEMGGKIFTEVSHVEITANRSEPAALCLLCLPSASNGAAKKVFQSGGEITVRWGYEGHSLEQIFTGFIREIWQQGNENIIEAIDRAALLFDTRVTRAFQFETPTTIMQSLLQTAKVDEYELEQIDKPLNRLPLVNNTIAEAIYYINRRIGLGHDFWFSPDGKFHWHASDKAEHCGYRLEYGKNILVFKLGDNGNIEITTVGLPVFHSQLIDVDLDGLDGEAITYFINNIRHTFGPGNRGSRSSLWLTRIY